MNELMRRLLFLPPQVSTWSLRVDHLHYFVITVTMIASAVVGLVAIVFLVRYRRRPGVRAASVSPPHWFEALIIVVPLSLFLLWGVIGFRDFVWLKTPPKDAMDVYVMGKQWMWKFAYPGGPNGLGVLRVPAGRPVRLLLTSRDVIHSFFVAALRIKQDALPGRYTEIWFEATKPGTYEVLCAEYCGLSHSMMRAELVVMPAAEFDAWLERERRGGGGREDMSALESGATIVEQGRQASIRHGCLRCHSVDGEPDLGPTWLDLYGREVPLEGGKTVAADPAYLTESMMDPMAKIHAGYQPVMPTFQGQLAAPEAAAIVEYIKSLQSDRLEPAPDPGPVYEPIRKR